MAVWTGYDYPKTQSSVKTLSIFRDFMEVIHKGKEKVEFKTASNVITKQTETQPETTRTWKSKKFSLQRPPAFPCPL